MAEVPAGVVTVTSTVPVPAGSTAVICVAETTVTLVAGVVPKSTAVAPLKTVPVMVTVVPPATGPEVGLMSVTTGAAAFTVQLMPDARAPTEVRVTAVRSGDRIRADREAQKS